MGWSKGSDLYSELIWILMKTVPEDNVRKEIYEHMFDAFENLDWDNPDECVGPDEVFDEIYEERFPAEVEDYHQDEQED
jgi:hypothetical protein